MPGQSVLLCKGGLQFKVRLSATQDDDILVNYQTHDGTAVTGIDYVQTAGSVLISTGEREVLITVSLLSGNIQAGGETFSLQAILDLSDGTYTRNLGLALVQPSPDVPPEPGLPILVDTPAQSLTVGIAVAPIALTNTDSGQLTKQGPLKNPSFSISSLTDPVYVEVVFVAPAVLIHSVWNFCD